MFDYLRCLYPSMPEEHRKLTYQTKSLECFMDQLLITEKGELWEKQRGDAARLHHHGDITFYTQDPHGSWVAYAARFTDGKLSKLTRLEDQGVSRLDVFSEPLPKRTPDPDAPVFPPFE